NALLGAAETQGANKVGAMIGARGCITQIAAGGAPNTPGEYLIAISWQGLNSTRAPAITCGQNQYPNATSPNEALRRVVSLPISIAYLK
ncbi:MAG: pilus assembly protein, partial [Gallionella sp.]|nr:pilus assembly protein [Gallionella sp.]